MNLDRLSRYREKIGCAIEDLAAEVENAIKPIDATCMVMYREKRRERLIEK